MPKGQNTDPHAPNFVGTGVDPNLVGAPGGPHGEPATQPLPPRDPNDPLPTAAPQTGGAGDFLGMQTGQSVNAGPGSLYQWQGPSVNELQREGADYGNRKAASFDTSAGGQYLGPNGMADQQGRQTKLEDALTATANGTGGPSAADIAAKQGQDANLANLLAASRSQRGPGAGLAGYNAAQAGASAGATAAQNAGQLKANEATQARSELAGVLNQQQSSNLTAAGQQQQMAEYNANLQQQQNATNASSALGFAGQAVQAGQGQAQQGIAQGQNYEAAQEANQKTASQNAQSSGGALGALGSAAGAVGSFVGGLFSDINAKQGIQPAGANDPQASAQMNSSAAPTGIQTQAPMNSPGSASGQQSAYQRQQSQAQAAAPAPGAQSFSQALQAQQPSPNSQPSAVSTSMSAPAPQQAPSLGLAPAPQPAATPMAAPAPVQQQSSSTTAAPAPVQQTKAQQVARPVPQQATPASAMRAGSPLMSDGEVKMDATAAGANAADINAMSNDLEAQQIAAGAKGQPGAGQPSIGDIMSKAPGAVASGGAESKAQVTSEMLNNSLTPDAVTKPGLGHLGGQATYDDGISADKYQKQEATLISDKRLKNVSIPGGEGTVGDKFLDALTKSQSTYTYKDAHNEPTDHPTGKKYLGIMAQAVEKTPTGDTIVKTGPKGKYLEMGPSLSAALAGLGRVNERLMSVEEAVGSRKPSKKGKK